MDLTDFLKDINNGYSFYPSPFNYTGSKFNLLRILKPYFPKSSTLIDLFVGGGSIFVNSPEYENIIANDCIVPLIEFYRFLQATKWEDVIRTIYERKISNDKEQYLKLRERFNCTHDCIDFFILVCSCTNNMMRFNKKLQFNQTFGERSFNQNTERKLRQYHNVLFNNENIKFSCDSFVNIKPPSGSFVYLDPPYLITEAGYNAYWTSELEERLYLYIDELHKNDVKFMLSNVSQHKDKINPNLHKLEKYNIIDITYDYNKVSRSGNSNSKEIIVTNY